MKFSRILCIKLRSVQTTVWFRDVTNGNILHFQSLFTADYLGSRKISGKKIKAHRNNGVRHNMPRLSMAVLKCYITVHACFRVPIYLLYILFTQNMGVQLKT